jgi:hypothetical protein
MKKVFLMFFVSLCFGVIGVVSWTSPAQAGNFPGDGVEDPQLRYKDNGNGTFTDKNTGFMWEIKNNNGGIHDVDNTYLWSNTGVAPDGPLFEVFLGTLNNTCRDDETIACVTNGDCKARNGGPGGPCGFAGYRDWCIPHVKLLQSIVDYGTFEPASSVPGLTAASFPYWSATTIASSDDFAWFVNFNFGGVNGESKLGDQFPLGLPARAVRPCP